MHHIHVSAPYLLAIVGPPTLLKSISNRAIIYIVMVLMHMTFSWFPQSRRRRSFLVWNGRPGAILGYTMVGCKVFGAINHHRFFFLSFFEDPIAVAIRGTCT